MIAEAAVSGLDSFTDRLALEEIEWLGRRPIGDEGVGEIGENVSFEGEGKRSGENEGEEGEEGEGEGEGEEEAGEPEEQQGGSYREGDREDEGGMECLTGVKGDPSVREDDLILIISNNDDCEQSHAHTRSQDDDPVYTRLPLSIARNYPSVPHPIGAYTLPPGAILPRELETLWLPVEVLEAHWAARRLSIVGRYDRRSYCFTHSYGRLYDKSSGSVYWEVCFRAIFFYFSSLRFSL
jgi:hypothetical protein